MVNLECKLNEILLMLKMKEVLIDLQITLTHSYLKYLIKFKNMFSTGAFELNEMNLLIRRVILVILLIELTNF